MKKIIGKISAVFTAAALTVAFVPQVNNGLTVNAETSADATTVTVKDYNNGIPAQSEMSLYDASGNLVKIGTQVDFTKDIAELNSQISDGEENASKNGAFENETDAENGIAKLTFDVTGKPVDPSFDVVLVLDESGSMNMSMTTDSSKKTGVSDKERLAMCPDQNTDHYYCLPSSLGFGNTADAWIQLKDYNTDTDATAFTVWRGMGDVWEKIKAKYNLTNTSSDFKNDLAKWKPWNHLYKKDASGNMVSIPALQETDKKYTSPVNNEDGSFDRMMLEKEQANIFANTLLDSSDNARVAVVGFNDTAYTRCELTSDKTAVKSALENYDGADNTNYTQALNQATAILNARTDTSRDAYVVFITDGDSYYGSGAKKRTEDALGEGAAIQAVQGAARVYAVGINSNAPEKLKYVAGKNGYYSDCTTTEQFKQVINTLSSEIYETSQLSDTIGENYDLYIDADHPLTAAGTAYTSVDSFPANITYSAADKKVNWEIDNRLLSEGQRMTFYVKLNPSKDSLSSTSGQYDTNGEAGLTYHKVVNGKRQDQATTVPLKSPSIKYDISTLPAQLTSDHMTDNNPDIMGTAVRTDDVIVYTIKVHNNGNVNVENVAVKDYIPQYTDFVSVVSGDGTYASSSNSVVWTIPEIPAGQDAVVQYSVKVKDVMATTELETITDTFKWGWGRKEDYTEKDPVCIGNVVNNPTLNKLPRTPGEDTDQGNVPNTGDQTNLVLYGSILGASLLLVLLGIVWKKKYSA